MSNTLASPDRVELIQETLHLLLSQAFICAVSHPESFKALLDNSVADEVNQTLVALGYELTHLGQEDRPTVFFSAPIDYNRKRDRDYAEKMIKEMRDDIDACLSFFLLIDQAGHGNMAIVSGGEIALGDVLNAVEESPLSREQLRDLEAHAMFESLTKRKDNKERLTQLFNVLQRQGYVVRRNNESSVYVFTGKVDYFHRMMAWRKDHHGLESTQEIATLDQRGLFE